MTTDTAERTEVQPADLPPETSIETPPDNAEPTTQADAAAETTEPTGEPEASLPDDPAEYAKSVLEKEGTDGTPEPQQRKPLIDPEVAARGADTLRKNFGDRQKQLDDMKDKLLGAGYSQIETEALIKDAKDILNSHHADALKYAGYEASQLQAAEIGNLVWSGINGLDKPVADAVKTGITTASKDTPDGQVSYDAVIKIVAEQAKEAGRKDGYAKGLEKGFRDGRSAREATAGGARSGQPVNGTAPANARTGPLTKEEAESLPIEELRAIRARETGQ